MPKLSFTTILLLLFIVPVILYIFYATYISKPKTKVATKAYDCNSECSDASSDDPLDVNVYDVRKEVDMFMEAQQQYLSGKSKID